MDIRNQLLLHSQPPLHFVRSLWGPRWEEEKRFALRSPGGTGGGSRLQAGLQPGGTDWN